MTVTDFNFLKVKVFTGLSSVEESFTIKIEISALQSLTSKSMFSRSLKTDCQSL